MKPYTILNEKWKKKSHAESRIKSSDRVIVMVTNDVTITVDLELSEESKEAIELLGGGYEEDELDELIDKWDDRFLEVPEKERGSVLDQTLAEIVEDLQDLKND